MGAERREIASFDKPFGEIRVGDSLFGKVLRGWQFVAPVPQIVAETWIVEHFANSVISTKGITPTTGPMKNWEVHLGIVVAAPMAKLNKEKLILLYKAGEEAFWLYLSRAARTRKP